MATALVASLGACLAPVLVSVLSIPLVLTRMPYPMAAMAWVVEHPDAAAATVIAVAICASVSLTLPVPWFNIMLLVSPTLPAPLPCTMALIPTALPASLVLLLLLPQARASAPSSLPALHALLAIVMLHCRVAVGGVWVTHGV